MDYLNSFREMISLRGLTDHTVKSYSTYIKVYLDYLATILLLSPEDASWQQLRDFIRWLKDSRSLSDRTINCAISQLRFFTIYVLHKPWDPSQLPMRKFDSYLPFVPSQEETRKFIFTIPDFSDYSISWEQQKTSNAIIKCKTDDLGYNLSECSECGYKVIHANSCRNRNGPNCQAVKKELWVDKRRSEVIDAPYFHVVFTLPHELNPLLYCNQKLLYDLLHRCSAETILELSADKKYLGATPGIIQVLHTWNQELEYHVHMHCIVSGGGITQDFKLRRSKGKFFIPVHVLRDKFKGKFPYDIVNITLHFFLKDIRPMLPPAMNHNIAVS